MDTTFEMTQLPGDGLGFEDVTDLFVAAAQDMDPEQMLFMEGFTLMDAMSAFEIGEPRLDTGYVGENPPPPFNPLVPLLPEEVCWILDRALGHELEWHSGNMLAHTVLTLNYIFHLSDMEGDIMFPVFLSEDNPERPIELITTILRPCVQGLLKSIDLAWREMHNNDLIQDTEDWQSDKCEVPLMEDIPVQYVIEGLRNAGIFAASSPKIPDAWRLPLRARITLRQTLLEMYNTTVNRYHTEYQILLDRARDCLGYLVSQPPIQISADSPVHTAFDPYISRRLSTNVPVRVIPLMPEKDVWDGLGKLLESLQETKTLVLCHHPRTWEIVGKLRLWLNDGPRSAYARSLAQTSYYSGLLILDQFTFSWALDRLFLETVGQTWSSIAAAIRSAWTKDLPPPIPQIERRLYKLVLQLSKSLWLNPPRLRRYLMKAVVEWHAVYDHCLEIADTLKDEPSMQDHIASKLPHIVLLFRLEAMREITLLGFQLELYAPSERPHAYWYAAKVIEEQLECYDELLPFLPDNSKPYHEMDFRHRFLLALGAMCSAMFLVTRVLVPLEWEETQHAFYRRWKWAYRPEYERIRAAPVAHPDLYEFIQSMDEETISPAEQIVFAKGVIGELLTSEMKGGWAEQWAPLRTKFLQQLLSACDGLSDLPGTTEELEVFEPLRRLKWDAANAHPWFPVVVPMPS